MQLHRGAGGFGGDRRRRARQALHPVDVEREVLAACRDDLVVEQGVPVAGREIGGDQVVLGERRKNSDHHDPGAEFFGFPVRISESGPQLLGQLVQNPPAQSVGNNIYFQVEHSEFGLEIMAGDPFENFGIHHPWKPVGACEIQLDLQSHQILGPVEPLLGQQPPQSREALLQLPPVSLPIGQVQPACHDLLPHRSVPPRVGTTEHRALVSRTIMPRLADL